MQVDAVRLLLQRGADPNAIDFDARSALDWALMAQRHELPGADGSDGDTWGTPRSPDVDPEDMAAIVQVLTMQTYRAVRVKVSNPQSELDALFNFTVQPLLAIPEAKCDRVGLRALSGNQSQSVQASTLTSPQPSTVLSLDGDDATLLPLTSTVMEPKPSSIQVCEQCTAHPAKVRCLNCAQVQCERCCVSLHKQDGRRHHRVRLCRCVRVARFVAHVMTFRTL